ncbi:MAG TPA: hypothetical protein P5023_06265 [Bacteroidales bacterium]|jgi:hypothetical protein|nr:hypothetical protein [Bacteroidales bacterium]
MTQEKIAEIKIRLEENMKSVPMEVVDKVLADIILIDKVKYPNR